MRSYYNRSTAGMAQALPDCYKVPTVIEGSSVEGLLEHLYGLSSVGELLQPVVHIH